MVIFCQEEQEKNKCQLYVPKAMNKWTKEWVSKETGELLNLLNYAIIIPSPP